MIVTLGGNKYPQNAIMAFFTKARYPAY